MSNTIEFLRLWRHGEKPHGIAELRITDHIHAVEKQLMQQQMQMEKTVQNCLDTFNNDTATLQINELSKTVDNLTKAQESLEIGINKLHSNLKERRDNIDRLSQQLSTIEDIASSQELDNKVNKIYEFGQLAVKNMVKK